MRNPAVPAESMVFSPVRDTYGSRLALVFGNEFKDGECPFYTAKQCNHCDIGAGEGVQFTPTINRERLEFFKTRYLDVLPAVNHLVIYNSGSTLNTREMSQETLEHILLYAASLKQCSVISLDSREMFVTQNAFDCIVRYLREDQQPRAILGIESQDDGIRMGKLNKKMAKEGIEKAFAVVGRYKGKAGVDINIVFQPPELNCEQAISEAVATLAYGLDLSIEYDVPVDFNYHPFYPTKRSREHYPNHPRADINAAKEALIKMKEVIDRRSIASHIFVGLQDEGHDQEESKRKAELDIELERFEAFNGSQDTTLL